MKTIKTLLLAIFLVFSSQVFADKDKPKNELKSVSKQIENLLKKSELSLYKDVTIKVKFRLNECNKIIDLTNNSNNDDISEFIKNRLYLKEIIIDKKSVNEFYFIPVKFTSFVN